MYIYITPGDHFQGFGVDLNPGGLDLEERLQLKSCLAADAIFLWRM